MDYCTKKECTQIWCAAITIFGAYKRHYYKIQDTPVLLLYVYIILLLLLYAPNMVQGGFCDTIKPTERNMPRG
jgi:hypothetical protein